MRRAHAGTERLGCEPTDDLDQPLRVATCGVRLGGAQVLAPPEQHRHAVAQASAPLHRRQDAVERCTPQVVEPVRTRTVTFDQRQAGDEARRAPRGAGHHSLEQLVVGDGERRDGGERPPAIVRHGRQDLLPEVLDRRFLAHSARQHRHRRPAGEATDDIRRHVEAVGQRAELVVAERQVGFAQHQRRALGLHPAERDRGQRPATQDEMPVPGQVVQHGGEDRDALTAVAEEVHVVEHERDRFRCPGPDQVEHVFDRANAPHRRR